MNQSIQHVAHRALWSGLAQDGPAQVGILGVPFDSATSWRGGARFAPQTIRSLTPHLAHSTEEGQMLTLAVCDYGDIAADLDWARYFATVEQSARPVIRDHQLALFLGGDHSVGIPLFKAFASLFDGPVGYIQIDSHADLCDQYEGHPWSHACTARRQLDRPNLSARHMALVGLRSFLQEELDCRAQYPEMGWHSARRIYRRGILATAADVVAQLAGAEAVYVSLDIDGIDPSCAPGTGTPEHGGPSTREVLEFLRVVFAGLPVRALDIVEVSPPLDVADMTSLAALKVIYEVFGWVQISRSA